MGISAEIVGIALSILKYVAIIIVLLTIFLFALARRRFRMIQEDEREAEENERAIHEECNRAHAEDRTLEDTTEGNVLRATMMDPPVPLAQMTEEIDTDTFAPTPEQAKEDDDDALDMSRTTEMTEKEIKRLARRFRLIGKWSKRDRQKGREHLSRAPLKTQNALRHLL